MKLRHVFILFLFLSSCVNKQESRSTCLKATITDFLLNGEEVSQKNIALLASNVDNACQLKYKSYTTAERLLFSVTFEVVSQNPQIRIGRDMGGFMEVMDEKINVYRLDSSLTNYELHETFDLPFQFLVGQKYCVSCEKNDANKLQYSIVSADNFFEIEYEKDKLTRDERRVAIGWGTPFFGLSDGNIIITDAVISSKYAPFPKLSIWGDSFVEGTSMIDSGLENRWCAILADKIGKEYCPIIGKGGERIDASFISRFKVENSWYNTPYVIISLGTNNDTDTYKKYMPQLISYIKKNNQIPILVTITPHPGFDYQTTTKAINDWVKESGEIYIDMHKAVTDPNNPSKWKLGYVQSDGVHPTSLGHIAMFRQIKIDCPFLIYL